MLPINPAQFAVMQQMHQMQQLQQIQQMQQIQQILHSQALLQSQQPHTQLDDEDNEVDDEGDRTLFCANLDERVDEEVLYELFLQAGPLECVRLPKQRTFAFIIYAHSCSPIYAMNLFQGVSLYGKSLVIKFQSKTAVPPLKRRLLPPDWGIVDKQMQSEKQKSSFDNFALRVPHFNFHASDMDVGENRRNSRRHRSPVRSSNQHIGDDKNGGRNEKDNWMHGPDHSRRERMERTRLHNTSGPYERRRESSRERERARDRYHDDRRSSNYRHSDKRNNKYI